MTGASVRPFLRVTVEKRLFLFRRYMFNSVMRIIAFVLIFATVFLGGQQLAPTAINNSLTGIIVGFFVWTMAARAYSDVSRQIETEATWGTLEQLFMSPFGIERVVFANSVLYIIGSVLSGLVVLAIMILTTNTTLSLPPSVVILASLTIAPVIGIGLALGGLTLLYKKVGAVTGLMQLFLVGFVAIPLDAHPVVAAMPLTVGTTILRTTMQAGTVFAVDPALLGLLVAKVVAYLVLGFGALHYLQQVARRRGVLGHY